MSLTVGDRRWAQLFWLGVLLVLMGTTWILWRRVSTTTERQPHQAPRVVVMAPPVARVENIDPSTLLPQILAGDMIDENALATIEKRGEPAVTAAAEFAAARYEHEHNREEEALNHIQRAVASRPSDAGLQIWCATLMLNAGQTSDAVGHAEQAARLEPESARAQRILGQAYYQVGRLDDAVTAWELSQQLSPDDGIRELLERAKREAAVEGHFAETARGHFILRYEGGKPAEALSDDLFRALERDYEGLATDLGSEPKSPVEVVFYSAQQFTDVTKSAAWVGALNDGKMRIPLGEVTSITPQLESVLRHELTHSFVHAAVEHCPTWLNEGLAQMEEPQSVDALAASLGPRASGGGFVPLSQLEGSFQGMSYEQAQRAYFESLSAVEYLRSACGMDCLRHVLVHLADGEQAENALHAATGDWYDELNEETKAYIAKRSGSDEAVR